VLDTADIPVAGRIARAMRESSGDIRAVRALGLLLPSRQLAQVSMNLLDYRRVPVRAVAERVAREARGQGVRVKEYELVGCAPADQFERWPDDLPPVAGLKPSQLLDPSLFAIGS
jgi:glutamate formiminotransferase